VPRRSIIVSKVIEVSFVRGTIPGAIVGGKGENGATLPGQCGRTWDAHPVRSPAHFARLEAWAVDCYIAVMSLRPILIHPDPRLKAVATPVEAVTDDLRRLADDMLETMYDAPGIGLAAPQVGQMLRMLVMDCVKEEGAKPEPMVLLNPEVVWSSEERSVYEEGCLSIPEQFAEIERPAEVKVRWTGLDGKVAERDFAGLWATCVQHEIDHLDGKLFIDYLKPLRRQMITRKMVKLKREMARA
jgi:peptide deformylase